MNKFNNIILFVGLFFFSILNVNAYNYNYCSNDEQTINVKYGSSTSLQYNISCLDLKNLYNHFIDVSNFDTNDFGYMRINLSKESLNGKWYNYSYIEFFSINNEFNYPYYYDSNGIFHRKPGYAYEYHDTGTTSSYNYNYDTFYNSLIYKNYTGTASYGDNINFIVLDDYFKSEPKYNVIVHNNLDDSISIEQYENRQIYSHIVDDLILNYSKIGYNLSIYLDSDYTVEFDSLLHENVLTHDINLYIKYELIYTFEYMDFNDLDFYSFNTDYKYLFITYKDKLQNKVFGSELFTSSFEYYYVDSSNKFISVCLYPTTHFGDLYFYRISYENSLGSAFVLDRDSLNNYYDFYLSKGAILTYSNSLSSISIPIYDSSNDEFIDTDYDVPFDDKNSNLNNSYIYSFISDFKFSNVFIFIGTSISLIYSNLSPLVQSYLFTAFMLGICIIILKIML